MDPNELLREIRKQVTTILTEAGDLGMQTPATKLAEKVQALDHWLTNHGGKEGRLPKDWDYMRDKA